MVAQKKGSNRISSVMSFRSRFIVILFCMAYGVASCEKSPITHEAPDETVDEIKVNSSLNQELPPEGGSIRISFSSSGTWTAQFVSGSPSGWCSANPLSGAKETQFISIYAGENDTDATRTAILRIASGNGSADINISQYYIEHLTISQNEFNVGPESQSIKVSVTSNVIVSVDVPQDCSWIHCAGDSSSSLYTFMIEENDNSEARIAEICFYGGKTPLSQILRIIQDKQEDSNPGIGFDVDVPGFGDEEW